jgi:hypothetical protein
MPDAADVPDPLLDELTRLVIHAALLTAELQAALDALEHDEGPANARGLPLFGG